MIKALNYITAYSLAQLAAQIALLGYGAGNADSLDDSWRQQPGTPVRKTGPA